MTLDATTVRLTEDIRAAYRTKNIERLLREPLGDTTGPVHDGIFQALSAQILTPQAAVPVNDQEKMRRVFRMILGAN